MLTAPLPFIKTLGAALSFAGSRLPEHIVGGDAVRLGVLPLLRPTPWQISSYSGPLRQDSPQSAGG